MTIAQCQQTLTLYGLWVKALLPSQLRILGGIEIDSSIIMSKARHDHPNTQPHTDNNSV